MEQFDFFVSYSIDDADKVVNIVESLEKYGEKCWYMPRDAVKEQYAKSIIKAIDNSKVFLLFLSNKTAVSMHALNEIELAYRKQKLEHSEILLGIVCLEPIDFESSEFDEMKYYIKRMDSLFNIDVLSSDDLAYEILKKMRKNF